MFFINIIIILIPLFVLFYILYNFILIFINEYEIHKIINEKRNSYIDSLLLIDLVNVINSSQLVNSKFKLEVVIDNDYCNYYVYAKYEKNGYYDAIHISTMKSLHSSNLYTSKNMFKNTFYDIKRFLLEKGVK